MRTIKILMCLMFMATAAILAAGTVSDRQTGEIQGCVTDAITGKPVVGARVLLVEINQSVTTDKEGCYRFIMLAPGSYELEITITGRGTESVKAVSVTAGAVTNVSTEFGRFKEKENEKKEGDEVSDSRKDMSMMAPSIVGKSRERVLMSEQAFGQQVLRCPPDVTSYQPPAHGGSAIVNGEPFDAMFFKHYGVNPFVDTDDDHLSTFAVDVDDASYIMARSYFDRGAMPPQEAIRTEEFINHFDYYYPAPEEEAFTVNIEGASTPFSDNSRLVKIGVKGREISNRERKPANLVFVIDVSGSMAREDRLGLVKRGLRMLVDQLRKEDRVGIVVYGSTAHVVLEPTTLRNKYRIIDAIESLSPSGATNAESGLMLGYRMAEKTFEAFKINRIVLCSDGVANVGITKAEDLLKRIKRYAEQGITLSAVGFGMGNYNDVLMEKLGNKGNGFYAYVDDIDEAHRVFVENLTGNLQVIARDVKIQVDFNKEVVSSYRLLGYENRDVADKRFRNDKEDGGEIGAGHSVTALYEIKLQKNGPQENIGVVYVRYKDDDYGEVNEINQVISRKSLVRHWQGTSDEFKLAACAAEFAEILRGSYWARGSQFADVRRVLKSAMVEDDRPEVIELYHLLERADELSGELAIED